MPAPKGTQPPGGSRKGRPNKATARREALIAAGGETPLDHLLAVMRDEQNDQAVRLDAAKAAAPYVHPRLASMTVAGDPNAPIKTISEIALVPVEPRRHGGAD